MKNFVIIGGSTGIGKALAEKLSTEHVVFATYKSNEVTHPTINYQYYDVSSNSDFDGLPEVIDGIAYCPGRIDLKPFTRFNENDFIEDYKVQVIGAIKVIQRLLPSLKKSEGASIVLFSTVAVGLGYPYHSMVASSKGAIEGLTKSLAAEFSPKIRVNCIAPSLTNTPLAAKLLSTEDKIQANNQRHPLKRIGTAEDIAQIAAILLSDQSSWITGQIMHIDGGMSTLKV